MRRSFFLALVLWAVCAFAEYKIDLGDNLALRTGADIRSRYEGFTVNAPRPDNDKDGRHDTEYLRIRTRVWGALDFGEDITLNLRLCNRFHSVTTSPDRKNNNGKSTWEFTDEVTFDRANVVLRNLLDGKLQLTLGRQDFALGKGLIFSEGTPFDQGRTVFSDGISAKFTDGAETVTVFSFFDRWKDGCVCINDRNRRLRSGDVFTVGAQWTHEFCAAVKLDAYYIFQNVDDMHPYEAERAHKPDCSGNIHTFGVRAFGKAADFIDYSVEMAHQAGRDDEHSVINANMMDARADFHLADESPFKPVFTLDFTHFSGDDPKTRQNEGWCPLMAQCPLWGEELMPIMLNGNWSNINSLRAAFSFAPIEKLTLALSSTEYLADEKNARLPVRGTGDGSRFGYLFNATATYKHNEHFSCQAQFSHFIAGNYFSNGHDSNWARIEITLTF